MLRAARTRSPPSARRHAENPAQFTVSFGTRSGGGFAITMLATMVVCTHRPPNQMALGMKEKQ
mgnify:CR=1 FL=1